MELPAVGTLRLERWRGSRRSSGRMTANAPHAPFALCEL